MPVLLASGVEVRCCKRGSLKFENISRIRCGMLWIGLLDLEYTYRKRCLINIKGEFIVKGDGFHCFAPGTIIYVGEKARMAIGNNVSFSHDNKFYIKKGLSIGDDNMWSYYNVIMDNDGHPLYDKDGKIVNENREIAFGNKVWMGCHCTVCKGVNIPDGTVIATNSVVRKSINQPNCAISTNNILRENIDWSRNLI